MSERGKVGARERARQIRDDAMAAARAHADAISADAVEFDKAAKKWQDQLDAATTAELAVAGIVRRLTFDRKLTNGEVADLTGLDAADVRRLLKLASAQPETGVIVNANPDAPTDTPNPERNPS